MRKLSVYVTGIPAFVEDYRRAIAVNALTPTTVQVGQECGHVEDVTIPAHFPSVRVPFNHIEDPQNYPTGHDWNVAAAPGVFPPDDPANPTSPVRSTLIKFLRFQEVELPPSTTPASIDNTPLNATGIPVDVQVANGPAPDASSLLWLAPMSSLGTSATAIDPRHVVKNPSEDVAAYIRFPYGKMSTAVATRFKFVAVTAVNGTQTGTLDRAVAQLVVCQLDVPDDAFSVWCRDYLPTGGAGHFQIRFKRDIPDPWLVFSCTSLEDTFQLPMGEETLRTDFHFRLVYRLAAGRVAAQDIALPQAVNPAAHLGVPRPLGAGGCVPPVYGGGGTGGQ